MTIIFVPSFMKIFLTVFYRHDFHRKKFKGALFRKKCRCSYGSFSVHCLIVVCICTKFHENILNGIRVMEPHEQLADRQTDTIFIGKNSKGHNSIEYEDGVTVFYLCTSSDGGLYLYKVT